MITAVEAAKQGVTAGGDTVSGLLFADDFVGTSQAPKGLQQLTGKALEYTTKWRVTANVKKCTVATCEEHNENLVTFNRK